MKRSAAEILEEYGPFAGAERVNGVTYDGQNVWFAAGNKLVAFEPTNGKMKRTIDVAAHAGTAFDGRHLFQIAEDRIQKIDPHTGRVLGSIPAPGGGGDSGLAWAEGTLWVGESRARKIHQIDPTGSSRASLGSRASSGTAHGRATRVRCGVSIRKAEKFWSSSRCRPG
jgi:outer membrane protein assembly factor BamB